MPPALIGQQQQQQQMLGTILEEDWMDDDDQMLVVHYEKDEWSPTQQTMRQKGQIGRGRTARGQMVEAVGRFGQMAGEREGPVGHLVDDVTGGAGRVGQMVDWWMGRGDKWPNEDEAEEEYIIDQMKAQKKKQQHENEEWVKLAKTTIALSPPPPKHAASIGVQKSLSNKSSSNHSSLQSASLFGKSSTTIPAAIPAAQNGNAATAAPAGAQCLGDDQQQKGESRGTEVSVSLQVVREHNITISASCCFAAAKKSPPSAREMMPVPSLFSSARPGIVCSDNMSPSRPRIACSDNLSPPRPIVRSDNMSHSRSIVCSDIMSPSRPIDHSDNLSPSRLIAHSDNMSPSRPRNVCSDNMSHSRPIVHSDKMSPSRPIVRSDKSNSKVRKTNEVDDECSAVKKLPLRLVNIELDDGPPPVECNWQQTKCNDGLTTAAALVCANKSPKCQQQQIGRVRATSAIAAGARSKAANEAREEEVGNTSTGWTQFKRNREQREHGVAYHRHHPPPKTLSPPFPIATFPPINSAAGAAAHSMSSLLPPLWSSCPQAPPPPPPALPSWLNIISNGSSSGVGSSVSSVSPKSTDGEGDRDSNNNGGGAITMEQYQHHQQPHFIRHATMMTNDRLNINGAADYRVISLDMRPEPGRLEDFVPEVERASGKLCHGTEIGSGGDTNKATRVPPAAHEYASAIDAKTLIREHRNYDLQTVDCWRRWSLRRVPTKTTAAQGGTKWGGGTLPAAMKRGEVPTATRRQMITDHHQGDDQCNKLWDQQHDDEGNGGKMPAAMAPAVVRRDEHGRLIVDRREWRQFMTEQRTPSSRRVESRIRLLNAACNNDGTADEKKSATMAPRRLPVIVAATAPMDERRTTMFGEENGTKSSNNNDNGTSPHNAGGGTVPLTRRVNDGTGWQQQQNGCQKGNKYNRTIWMG